MRDWARWPDAVALARIATITNPAGTRTLRFADAQFDVSITTGAGEAGGVSLREDGGIELREDGGRELREGSGTPGETFTFKAEPGCISSAIAYSNDGTVANCEVMVAAYEDGQLKPGDVLNGLFDGSTGLLELCDPTSPESGTMILLSGFVGQVKESCDGQVSFELRSVLSIARAVVTEQMGPRCRAELGDDRCKKALLPADIARNTAYVKATSTGGTLDYDTVNSAWGRVRIGSSGNPTDYQNLVWECTTAGTTASSAPAYSGPIGTVITDGTAQFTARASLARYAMIDSIVDGHNVLLDALPAPGASADGFYTLGTIILRSGENAGISFPLSNWIAAGFQARFFLDISQIIVGGEWIEIMPGCDKTEETCFGTYNNIINRRAETFAPGRDLALTQLPLLASDGFLNPPSMNRS